MIKGIERRKIFRNDKDRDDFLELLSILLPKAETSCYAWAFLANHAHFLFRAGNNPSCDIDQKTAYRIRREFQ
jgi:putative transposase